MAKRGDRSNARQDRDLPDYTVVDSRKLPDGPDVLLDVPIVKVDQIDIEVEDLRAQVAVMAEARDLVEISVGADVSLGRVKLRIEGVEAQVLLKAKLANVHLILERVLTSLDRNPELLRSVGRAVEEAGEGAGHLAGEAGEAVEDVGEGAGSAVRDVGRGTRKAAGQVGEGAGEALSGIGQGAGGQGSRSQRGRGGS